MGELVERFDFCRLDAGRVRQTSQGFLTLDGRLTRVGVLDYYRADGSKYRELRHPDDVFDAASLRSLAMAPVTDLHGGMVNPDNVQALSVGIVGHDVQGKQDGPFVTGSATIQRADTIKAVLAKRRNELSPGYRCEVQDGAGTWDGRAFGLGVLSYDGRQRGIDYNHLALGPKDWGRSGRDVALRIDALEVGGAFARCDAHGLGGFLRDRLSLLGRTDSEIASDLGLSTFELGMLLDGFTRVDGSMLGKLSGLINVPVDQLEGMIPASEKGEAIVGRRDNQGGPPADITTRTDIMKKNIVLNGTAFEVEIADALAPTFDSMLEKLHTDAKALPEVQGKLLAAEKAHADDKVKLDAATDPKALEARINARTKAVQDAKRIAPTLEVRSDMDDRALKTAALIASGFEASDFEKADASFVDGCFASALRGAPAAGPVTPLRSVPGPRFDGGPTLVAPTTLDAPVSAKGCTTAHSDAARDRMIERNRKASGADLDKSKAEATAK